MRFAAIIFICFFSSCGAETAGRNNEDLHLINEAKQLLKPGDLVLRAGKSYASERIRELSLTDKSYSHAGIAVPRGSGLKICSIEPIDESSPTDSIRYDPLEVFVDPGRNSSFAIYRYNLDDRELRALLNYISKYNKAGIVFDPEFRYETNDKMYCSEMISKALDSATRGNIELERSLLTHPSSINSIVRHFKKYGLTAEQVRTRPVVLIDNVYRHPECSLIKKVDFRP